MSKTAVRKGIPPKKGKPPIMKSLEKLAAASRGETSEEEISNNSKDEPVELRKQVADLARMNTNQAKKLANLATRVTNLEASKANLETRVTVLENYIAKHIADLSSK